MTVRQLFLVRHAKSSWKDSGAADHDRVLNRRGERDAPEMGQRLAARRVMPDRLVTSTAERARTTAAIIARALGCSERLEEDRRLYLASADEILDVLGETDSAQLAVMLFGHNPGITQLVNRLARVSISNVPTCGIAVVEFTAPDWQSVNGLEGQLANFDYPKNAVDT